MITLKTLPNTNMEILYNFYDQEIHKAIKKNNNYPTLDNFYKSRNGIYRSINHFGTPIGMIYAYNIIENYACLTAWLGKEYQNQGILKPAFEKFSSNLIKHKINKIEATIFNNNNQSKSAFEKLGFILTSKDKVISEYVKNI